MNKSRINQWQLSISISFVGINLDDNTNVFFVNSEKQFGFITKMYR